MMRLQARIVPAVQFALPALSRLTILPNRDHYILDAYENQDLYSWFLQHKRGAK